MKRQQDKQEIAQLLSKFMAGETSLAEEQVLAQYFRTHEVDEEWTEYKEMFSLFDNGEVDIELEAETAEHLDNSDSGKIRMLPKTVREKPKIIALKWLTAVAAACALLLLVFHFGRSAADITDCEDTKESRQEKKRSGKALACRGRTKAGMCRTEAGKHRTKAGNRRTKAGKHDTCQPFRRPRHDAWFPYIHGRPVSSGSSTGARHPFSRRTATSRNLNVNEQPLNTEPSES